MLNWFPQLLAFATLNAISAEKLRAKARLVIPEILGRANRTPGRQCRRQNRVI